MSPALGATGPVAAKAPRYWCPGAPLRCAHPPPPTHTEKYTLTPTRMKTQNTQLPKMHEADCMSNKRQTQSFSYHVHQLFEKVPRWLAKWGENFIQVIVPNPLLEHLLQGWWKKIKKLKWMCHKNLQMQIFSLNNSIIMLEWRFQYIADIFLSNLVASAFNLWPILTWPRLKTCAGSEPVCRSSLLFIYLFFFTLLPSIFFIKS